jgi:pyridoxal phosphate enzyme (YggS family)
MSMPIVDNIAAIEERIVKACERTGRNRSEITLMAVSKLQSILSVQEAYNAGIRCFGESRVKEGCDKYGDFRNEHPDITLHLIGSLQRNKVKSAVQFFDCIQSVDRISLIGEIAKHTREKALEILFEMHTGEESKRGFANNDELFHAAELVFSGGLQPRGLMTMAPFTDDERLVRASFKSLARAQGELIKRFPPAENWACLSMGMSGDFEIAIEEGSTMLRIGGVIFNQ